MSPRFKNKEIWRRLHCVILEQLELLLPSLNHLSTAVPAVGAPWSFAGNRLYNTKTTNAQAAALPVEKRISLVGNRLELQPRHTALLNALQLNRLDWVWNCNQRGAKQTAPAASCALKKMTWVHPVQEAPPSAYSPKDGRVFRLYIS